MSSCAIDINDPSTYSNEISSLFKAYETLFNNYHHRENELLQIRKKGDLKYLTCGNKYANEYKKITETLISSYLEPYQVKGWHYTRLIKEEIENIRENGIIPSTKLFMASRLKKITKLNHLTEGEMKMIINQSPLIDPSQEQAREGRFFFTSFKPSLNYPRITDFISYWGGEVVYFAAQHEALKDKLKSIGKTTILELNVPIKMTKQASQIGTAMLANFFDPQKKYDVIRELDLHITEQLAPSQVNVIDKKAYVL